MTFDVWMKMKENLKFQDDRDEHTTADRCWR